MKTGIPRINVDVVARPMSGRFANGQPTHPHPRWGGARSGSGRKRQATSAAQFVKLSAALTPRHVALLDAHREQFETASRSASLRVLLDEYIASVPDLAATLDQIVVTERGGAR